MAKIRVILAEEDLSFLVPLEQRFVETFFDRIDLSGITDPSYMRSYFSVPRQVDILVVSEELYEPALRRHAIGKIFVLCEGRGPFELEDGIRRIDKYSSVTAVFEQILGVAPELMECVRQRERSTSIVLVCSPGGGTGSSTTAVGISAVLASRSRRVLLISAEHLQTFQRLLADPSPIGSREVYRALVEGAGDLYREIRHTVRTEGFAYVPPFRGPLSAHGIPFSVYRRLTVSARKSGEYDIIVVHTTAPVGRELNQLIDLADQVLVIGAQTRASAWEIRAFLESLHGTDPEKFSLILTGHRTGREDPYAQMPELRHLLVDRIGAIDGCDDLMADGLAENHDIQRIAHLVM